MRSATSHRIQLALPVAAVAAALIVAGCSGQTSTPSGEAASSSTASMSPQSSVPQAGDFNDADVTFLQDMYPHHAQAIQMAQAVTGRTGNADLVALAAAIESAQGPEMTQMASLLTGWGKPAPTTNPAGMGMSGAPGMPGISGAPGMGGMGNTGSAQTPTSTLAPMPAALPGMMSEQDLGTMMGMSGAQFDTTWLTMMTAHHQGAVAMSQTELANGTNMQAKKLATDIITAQQGEITKMATMLGQK